MNERQIEIKENQKVIRQLTTSIGLWLNTPHAQKQEIKAQVLNLQDRTMFALEELELQGQRIKIENMEKVISLLKTGK